MSGLEQQAPTTPSLVQALTEAERALRYGHEVTCGGQRGNIFEFAHASVLREIRKIDPPVGDGS